MLQQDVLLADGLEQVVSAGQRPRQPRAEWRELQLRVIFQAGDREQPGQVDRTVDLVQLRFCQAELAQQKIGQRLRTVVGNLQAYCIAVSMPLQE